MRRVNLLGVLAILTLAIGTGSAVAAPDCQTPQKHVRSLWSPIFQKEVVVHVSLPKEYACEPQKEFPSIYTLHGGIKEDRLESVPGAATQWTNEGIVQIHPEAGSPWMNGRQDPDREISFGQRGVRIPAPYAGEFLSRQKVTIGGTNINYYRPYETHFVKELIPFIEGHYRVRRDRAGRGVTGGSGGGLGSWLLGFRHPDLFSVVVPYSTVFDCPKYRDPSALDQSGCYLVMGLLSGGRDPITDEIYYRGIDGHELAENLLGSGILFAFAAGDGLCKTGEAITLQPENIDPENPRDLKNLSVVGGDALPICTDDAVASHAELTARAASDRFALRMDELGYPYTYVKIANALHGGDVAPRFWPQYRDKVVAALAAPPTGTSGPPGPWRYKTIERSFGLWGYEFAIRRANTEFLTLLDVTPAGFTARGTGTLDVQTPPQYSPGTVYEIARTAPDGTVRTQAIEADSDGRLRFPVILGQPRIIDQNSELERAGLFTFEDYSVTITANPNAQTTETLNCEGTFVYPFFPCTE